MVRINIDSPFHGAPVYYKEETATTMVDAKNLALQGLPSGTTVLAGNQVCGRGRVPGRTWVSEPGKNLVFSFFLKIDELDFPVTLLPLKVGLALSLALESNFRIKPTIKWPNDVLVDKRKIAGILCETKGNNVFIGMGLNCNQTAFPRDLRRKATSIRKAAHKFVDLKQMLLLILSSIELVFRDREWRYKLESRLFLKDKTVTFLAGHPEKQLRTIGDLKGVDEDGKLIILPTDAGETCSFASGEIIWN